MNCTGRNTTDLWSSELVLALGIFQALTNMTAVVCNCGVIIILYGKHSRRPIYILFCSLASSDLLTSISGLWASLLFIAKPESTISGSEDLLQAYSIFAIALLATIYNLMSIGIERYLAVSNWARLRFKVSKSQSLTAVLVNWGLAILFGSLPLLGWNCHGCIPKKDTEKKPEKPELSPALQGMRQAGSTGECEALKALLYNPHLRQLLRTVDEAEGKESTMKVAMQEPLFVEFADQCLRVIEPPEK
ncbi:Zinc finger HIT domain-containing protein 3 [Acipenser ruthenus]|uniref:Zinc finger HIT domain-containing protein 3 n=1 Tax=Acipenser ruthenus TaxID=7906 RepID=A0A444V6P3_ACIRT|nr:Zinc finger HIT domain-containing protein 3 [Acipenser ruthenus]